VVLPQPLGPKRVKSLSPPEIERDVLRGVDRLAAFARIFSVQRLDAQHDLLRAASSSRRSPSRTAG
jgi:hypothetical protein